MLLREIWDADGESEELPGSGPLAPMTSGSVTVIVAVSVTPPPLAVTWCVPLALGV